MLQYTSRIKRFSSGLEEVSCCAERGHERGHMATAERQAESGLWPTAREKMETSIIGLQGSELCQHESGRGPEPYMGSQLQNFLNSA